MYTQCTCKDCWMKHKFKSIKDLLESSYSEFLCLQYPCLVTVSLLNKPILTYPTNVLVLLPWKWCWKPCWSILILTECDWEFLLYSLSDHWYMGGGRTLFTDSLSFGHQHCHLVGENTWASALPSGGRTLFTDSPSWPLVNHNIIW